MTTALERTPLLPFAAASAAACAIGVGGAVFSGVRPAVFGAGAATLAAIGALAALAAGVRAGTVNGLLGAFTVGFFCRMILVALGLIALGAHGTDRSQALAYVGSFFALYLVTQVIEILFVRASSRQP